MKVLWVCNIMLPAIARQLQLEYSNREGWLSGSFDRLQEAQKNGTTNIKLGVCYPVAKKSEETKLIIGRTVCYGFREELGSPEVYDPDLEVRFHSILEDFSPDIVHIFGTEFPHTLAVTRAFEHPERTLIGLQGLCAQIGKVYMANLPKQVVAQATLRDHLRKDSLLQQQAKFLKRGEHESAALKLAGHVTGRTEFDRKGSFEAHPTVRYHYMNETMRQEFYTGSWNLRTCKKHCIFLGQGDYPLKGFHFVLEALPEIKAVYPDVELMVAGSNIIAADTLKARLKLPAYGKYLRTLIQKNHLENQVTMLGRLTAEQMKEQYMNCSVYVCASILENSPNTIGEAMLLGVPVVAANVGGVPDMITDEKEGYLFSAGDSRELVQKILAVFADEDAGGIKTLEMSTAAGKRSRFTHNADKNYERLLQIYQEIYQDTDQTLEKECVE